MQCECVKPDTLCKYHTNDITLDREKERGEEEKGRERERPEREKRRGDQ